MKLELTLVGEDHFDMKKGERMRRLFRNLKPSVIGIEETQEDFERFDKPLVKIFSDSQLFERGYQYSLQSFLHANPKTLRSWLYDQCDSAKSILDYVHNASARLLFCENVEEMKRIEPLIVKQMRDSKSNLMRELTEFLKLDLNQALENIEKEYACVSYPVLNNRSYKISDASAEQLLRKQSGRVVYLGGLDHIFGDYYPNLYDRLGDLNPKRMKLNEADRL